MSDTADFGNDNIKSWSNEVSATGTVKVFDGGISTIVDATQGYKAFDFDSLFVFDTTKGKHLKVFVEFTQTTRQPAGTIPNWAYESDISVPAFVSQNETKYNFNFGTAPDTTRFSQVRKPSIRIYHPRHDSTISIGNIYCLGELGTLMSPIDTIHVRIRNTGYKKVRNHGVELSIIGANTFKDTLYIDSLDAFAERMIHFTSYKPKSRGIDSLTIRSLNDDYVTDDTGFLRRRIGLNILSHNNPFVNDQPFGIGFSGGTGDFVAKYYTDSNYINQIQIGFQSNGLAFQLGIWDEDANGRPGNLIYKSDTLFSNGGKYVQPVLPKVQVKGGYYVGILQIQTTNVGFIYETETPVRDNVFYFTAPTGNTTWTPFSPGFDYNFDIQPRIQVANDVAVLRISNPIANDTFEFSQSDSLAPKATILNYGARDQKIPFDVVCEARDQFGNLIYKSTKVITLKADDSTEVTFDKTLSLANYGDINLIVYTKLPTDQALENDTLGIDFGIYVSYDIQVESFFDPEDGNRYELNKDKIAPTVRMVNFGSKDQNGIRVTSRIRQGNFFAQSQTVTIDLLGGGSQILSFDSITIPFHGAVVFEVFCWNHIDSFPINDTARVTVDVIRSNDLGIHSLIRPLDSSVYTRNETFSPYLNYRNYGLADQDSVVVTSYIYQTDGTVIYRDTSKTSVIKLTTRQALFKDFTTPDSAQTLYFFAKTWIDGDQNLDNDTIESIFFVKTKTDLEVVESLAPTSDSLYQVGDTLRPILAIKSIGINPVDPNVKVRIRIYDENGQLQTEDSVYTPEMLIEGQLDTLAFATKFVPKSKGSFKAQFILEHDKDGERSNDTLEVVFDVSYKYSFALVDIVHPISEKNYRLNLDTIEPFVGIQNNGILDLATPLVYEMTITDALSAVVYSDIDTIKVLEAGESLDIIGRKFAPPAVGRYQFTVEIRNDDDQITTDNELSNFFNVSLGDDVKPLRFTFPEIDSTLFANRSNAPRAKFINVGDSDQTDGFSVSYLVMRNGSTLYNSNRTILLNSGDSQEVTFDATLNLKEPGEYTMMIITRLGPDQVKPNDTLIGTFNVDWHISVGDIDVQAVKVYPNPTSQLVQVETGGLELKGVRLIDALGRDMPVKTLEQTPSEIQLDVSSLPNQTYWLYVETATGSVWKEVVVLR